jgi:DNA-binding MarR family transcriptional regulator
MSARRGPTATAHGHARRRRAAARRDGARTLAGFVPYRLATLAKLLALVASRLYAKRFGLVVREWQILAVLGEGRPLSAAEVARRTVIDKGRVSRAVASLTRRGLIERAPDAFDARRTMLRLSQKGRAIYRRIVPLARGEERALLDPLTPAERRQLERLLGKLHRQGEAMLARSGGLEGLDEGE